MFTCGVSTIEMRHLCVSDREEGKIIWMGGIKKKRETDEIQQAS